MNVFFDENKPAKVIVADDHALIRFGLIKVLSTLSILEIIDEASDGLELIEKCKTKNPDMILIDIFMPEMNELEAIPIVRRICPDANIIAFSGFDDAEIVEAAINSGADGFLTKDLSPSKLKEAILKVISGKKVFSQNVIDSLNKKKEKKLQFDFQHMITKKEEIILELVSKGYTNLDISQKLNLSKRTIESHRYNLMKKLDLKTAHQLLSFAIYFFTSKQSIVK